MNPTHLYADTFAAPPLCGIKPRTWPAVALEHAQAHIDGHGLEICPDCWTVWKGDVPQPMPGQMSLFGASR